MSVAAATPAQALRQLEARLRGTSPRHAPDDWRFGAARVGELPPALRTKLPAAPVPAAVLVGLVDHPHDPALLLTVRASALRRHAGQIAFPGGRIEPDDGSPALAALREASEEIGLAAEGVDVLGYLPDHIVLTGYRVTPVVARIPPGAALRLHAGEVEEVFELPWSALLDDSRHVHGERRHGDVVVPVRDIHHAGHRIWGLTAAILVCLRELGSGGA